MGIIFNPKIGKEQIFRVLSEGQRIDLSTYCGYFTLHNLGLNPFPQVKLGEMFKMKLFGVCF